ncbi:hypothetical protein [Ruminococcus champanellensis]|uniref:hypothetical protein n=1 Tax=Ruminococcus champanellensis TaxID=1161942 RepID=UPI0023F3347D|nr:hypothetical protein [Ruminococcus champanellensis]
MKKLAALLLTCSMLAAVTGCGDNKDSSSQAATEAASTAAATTEAATTEAPTEAPSTERPAPTPTVDENAITFEDGDLYTAHSMAEKNYENDESATKLTIEEFNGTKQLRVQVLDKDDSGTYKVPKVVFNLAELVGAENLNKIKSISCDITGVAVGMFTGDDGSEMLVPGNVMGALGGNLAAEKKTDADGGLLQNTWANLTEFSFAEWENNWVYSHVEANILLDANRYEAGYDGATLVLMRWGIPNQADLYIDNITFYDEDGKSIPLAYKPSGDAAGTDSSKAE